MKVSLLTILFICCLGLFGFSSSSHPNSIQKCQDDCNAKWDKEYKACKNVPECQLYCVHQANRCYVNCELDAGDK